MRLPIKFTEHNQRLTISFNEVHNISDGGYERGYEAGSKAGYKSGYNDGYDAGYDEGYIPTQEKAVEITENGTVEILPDNGYTLSKATVSVDVDVDAVFEAGKKAEYDANWANLREETYFTYAFSGYYWTDSTFKPPFDIKPVGMASAMFRQNKITNLKKCFEDAGTTLDTARATRSDYMFAYSNMLTSIPKLDFSLSTNVSQAFYECASLVTIAEIKFGESTTFASTFYNCKELVNMIVTGVIAQNGFNVSSSKKLSKASITSIINALSANTSGLTVTISKTSVVAAFGSTDAAEWTALVATKPNWTISLA